MKNIRDTFNMKILKNNCILPTHYSSSIDLKTITLSQNLFFFFNSNIHFLYHKLSIQTKSLEKESVWKDVLCTKVYIV